MNTLSQDRFNHRWVSVFSALIVFVYGLSALAQGSILSSITVGSSLTRFAAGDSIPVSVALTNYGGAGRVDAVVNYAIVDAAGNSLYSEHETVAVETVLDFEHQIKIPQGIGSGEYSLVSAVSYAGQPSPSVSSFRFAVKKKFLGIFASDLAVYMISAMVIAAVYLTLGKRGGLRHPARNAPRSYAIASAEEKVFYDIIGDIIAQIRRRIGNRAMEIAGKVQGLKIDKRTGKVIKLTKDPAEIIAMLIYRFEKFLGTKIIATPEPLGKDMAGILRPVNKNLSIIEKYFNVNGE